LPKGPPDAEAFHAALIESAVRGIASTQAYFRGLADSAARIVPKLGC
jgi:hypothetical protein